MHGKKPQHLLCMYALIVCEMTHGLTPRAFVIPSHIFSNVMHFIAGPYVSDLTIGLVRKTTYLNCSIKLKIDSRFIISK